MKERFPELRTDITIWLRNPDGDLIIAATHPVATMIEAEADPSFSPDEKKLIRSALLVRLYDSRRSTLANACGERETIENWMAERMPDGVEPDYPYKYLLEEPRPMGSGDEERPILVFQLPRRNGGRK